MVFQEKKAAQFINKTFVPFKIVKNQGQYKELRQQFDMLGFPTIIVLDSNGKERDRIVGFGNDADLFVKTIADYAENKNTLALYQKEYAQDSTSVQANYNLAIKYLERYENQKAAPFFANVLTLDPDDSFGYKQKAEFNMALHQARYEENELPLENMLKNLTDTDMLETGYFALIRSLERKGDSNLVLMTYKRALNQLPGHASLMNAGAWYIYENKLDLHYDWGIELAQNALEIEPESESIWDTLAWLYFEKGDKANALKAMQKAASFDPNNAYYIENLNKFKAELES